MPSTTLVNPSAGFAAYALQARTDSSGSGVDDVTGEDLRIILDAFSAGIVAPSAAFQVVEDSPEGMTVVVGSGTAATDVAIVQGTGSGQGKYAVRLGDATTDVTITAADVSNPRIDEIYLVVQDNAYDSSSRVLPRIGYRSGDAASSPSAPGPDGSWDAYLLLATVAVGTGVTEIQDADITDERVVAAVADDMVQTDSIADLAVTGAKGAAAFLQSFEVDNSTEVASYSLTGSFADAASVSLSIPAGWGSWKCEAWASYVADGVATGGVTYETAVSIDGTPQQVKQVQTVEDQREGAVGGRRSGMTSTGSRSVTLRARRSGGSGGSLEDVYLYARAVRLS